MYTEIQSNITQVCDTLSLLSNEKRLMMLCFIGKGEKTIGELTTELNISQSLTSQFAIKMKACGLLKSEKKGKEVYYSVADTKALELVLSLKKIYCTK